MENSLGVGVGTAPDHRREPASVPSANLHLCHYSGISGDTNDCTAPAPDKPVECLQVNAACAVLFSGSSTVFRTGLRVVADCACSRNPDSSNLAYPVITHTHYM